MSLLGLDVGTTGTKAIVFNLEGNILGQAYREYPLIYPQPGWIELDSKVVWEAVKETIKEAVAKAGGSDPVKALSTSVQGEAVTPVSKAGEILYNSIVTFDNRTLPQSQWWEEKVGKRQIFTLTGRPLHPMYTINKIMWWRDNAPEVFQRTWKFLCYGDLVLYKLGVEPTIDYSMAGTTMVFDLHKKDWSLELLNLADLEVDKLAKSRPSGEVVDEISPDIARDLGLPKGVLAVTGGHDQPCGALGAGIIKQGIAMDATGTVECITPAFSQPMLNEDMLNGNFCCYCHVVPDMYVSLAFNFSAGSLLRWYRDTFGTEELKEAQRTDKDVYEIIIGKASSTPSNIYILPHFTVTGTPWLDANSKGAILGLSLATEKGEIIRAILEGITYELKLNLEHLAKAGLEVKELRAIGGGAKSNFWLQLKATIFNKPVVSLNISEAACLGAALLAGVAIGEYKSLTEAVAQTIKVKATFEPDQAEAQKYQEKFQLYAQIYPALADLLHKMR